MFVTPEQNVSAKGYGAQAQAQTHKSPEHQLLGLWANFYKLDHFPTFQEAQDEYANGDSNNTYILCAHEGYLHCGVYRERMRLVIEPFLLEANERAREQGKAAFWYVHGTSYIVQSRHMVGSWYVHAGTL